MDENELKDREGLRRKALWTLAHLTPGDPTAVDVIKVLDEVDEREQFSGLPVPTLDEVLDAVVAESRPTGYSIVRESNIPLPWRERFLRASVGSTRVADGPYDHDWKTFLQEWEAEVRHLAQHRAAMAQVQQRRDEP